VVQPPTVHKVQYDLGVIGNFYQLLRYISLLEQHKRFIGVDNFSIAKGPGGEAKSTAQPKRDLRITIYSYTYKLPPAPLELGEIDLRSGKSTDIPD
jgi:hypothetical protein